MLVTLRTSVPTLETMMGSEGVAPRNVRPKSMASGSTAMSGAPVTCSTVGTITSGARGSLFVIVRSAK